MGLFGAHTYPTVMRLDADIPNLKRIQSTYNSCNTPVDFWWNQHFFNWKSAAFVISRITDIDCILIHNFFFSNFFEPVIVVLIYTVAILMMTAKLATLDIFKRKVFWNKVYDVINSVRAVINFYHVTQTILQTWSCYQNFVTIAFRCEKLSQPQCYNDLTSIIKFLDKCSWFKFNIWRLGLATAFKFDTSMTRGLKLKVRKFWRLIPTFT